MKPLRILIGCEFSGIVREAFRRRGHDAWSCDLLPSEQPGPHYRGDIFDVIDGWMPVMFSADYDEDGNCPVCGIEFAECAHPGPTQDEMEYTEKHGVLFARPESQPSWDMMIAFPPCTDLCVSGAKYFAAKRADGRQQKSIDFFVRLANAPIHRIAIENPTGIMSSVWRKPDQIIQPFFFGDEAQKTTCIWLKNLRGLSHDEPLFMASTHVGRGEMVTFASGCVMPKWYADAWRLPKEQRARIRSTTFPGVARAMAEQWG